MVFSKNQRKWLGFPRFGHQKHGLTAPFHKKPAETETKNHLDWCFLPISWKYISKQVRNSEIIFSIKFWVGGGLVSKKQKAGTKFIQTSTSCWCSSTTCRHFCVIWGKLRYYRVIRIQTAELDVVWLNLRFFHISRQRRHAPMAYRCKTCLLINNAWHFSAKHFAL